MLKKTKSVLSVVFAVMLCAMLSCSTFEYTNTNLMQPRLALYVSTEGDDSNSGEVDSPLKTLDGARSLVRRIKEEDGLPHG